MAKIKRDKKKKRYITLGYKGIVFQKTCLHFPIATVQTKKQATFRNVIDMLFKQTCLTVLQVESVPTSTV